MSTPTGYQNGFSNRNPSIKISWNAFEIRVVFCLAISVTSFT